tara:strand:- start:4535 stop:5068 length:534 start_codon:yes stop_codon:yes gene_type:complete
MSNYRQNMFEAYKQVKERELTKKELKRREEIAKELPDKEFKDRYGKDWMSVKMATATKMAKKESVEMKEDGHEDVPSAIRQCKTVIEDANEIMNKLNSMSEQELPSWWTNKLAVASNSMNKMRDYILNPVTEEVITEAEGDLEDLKKMVKELEGASKMHLGQSKRIAKHIGMMENKK